MASRWELAVLGIPSVEEIVRKVVDALFGALSQALLPDFLRDGTVDAVRWLVAVPNPANASLWPNLARLEENMIALAFGLLALSLTVAAIRYTVAGFSGGPHPMTALAHTVGAAAALVLYHWAFANMIALVNALTNTILSWPLVAQGLARTVRVMFGGALIVGSGSAFLALLALAAIFVAATLFLMKVAVLMVAAMLYVAGPVVIAVSPIPELGRVARLWLLAAIVVGLVPLGWCVIFATAGALSLDVTSFNAIGSQDGATVIAAKTTGAFAALLTFAIAAWWPLKIARHVGSLAGIGSHGPSSASTGSGAASARVRLAQARLRAGVVAGGSVAGRFAGALGAPRGGLAGASARTAQRAGRALGASVAARPEAVAGMAAAAGFATRARPGVARFGRTRAGRAVAARATAAGRVVRGAPAEIRQAVAAAGRRRNPGRGRGPMSERRAGARPVATASRPAGRARASSKAQASRPPASGRSQPTRQPQADGATAAERRISRKRRRAVPAGVAPRMPPRKPESTS